MCSLIYLDVLYPEEQGNPDDDLKKKKKKSMSNMNNNNIRNTEGGSKRATIPLWHDIILKCCMPVLHILPEGKVSQFFFYLGPRCYFM